MSSGDLPSARCPATGGGPEQEKGQPGAATIGDGERHVVAADGQIDVTSQVNATGPVSTASGSTSR